MGGLDRCSIMENDFAKYQGISAWWDEKCTFSVGIVAIALPRSMDLQRDTTNHPALLSNHRPARPSQYRHARPTGPEQIGIIVGQQVGPASTKCASAFSNLCLWLHRFL